MTDLPTTEELAALPAISDEEWAELRAMCERYPANMATRLLARHDALARRVLALENRIAYLEDFRSGQAVDIAERKTAVRQRRRVIVDLRQNYELAKAELAMLEEEHEKDKLERERMRAALKPIEKALGLVKVRYERGGDQPTIDQGTYRYCDMALQTLRSVAGEEAQPHSVGAGGAAWLSAAAEYGYTSLRCEDCGGPHPFDTSLPNEVWNQIADPGALLCLFCIDKRLVAKGLTCDEAEFYFNGKALRSKLYAESHGDVAYWKREAAAERERREGAEAALAPFAQYGRLAVSGEAFLPGGPDPALLEWPLPGNACVFVTAGDFLTAEATLATAQALAPSSPQEAHDA